WVEDQLVAALRKEAQASIKADLILDLAGSDIDARMIEIATKNAFAAGVEQDIVFKQMRVQDLRPDKINGVIISNPPYGDRLLD
ncbi:class I SAM-dependent RNA methyltransferase, partial [Streptococcus suis]